MTTDQDHMLRAFFMITMTDPPPVSVNKLYSSNGVRRFLTAEGARYKDALASRVAEEVMLHAPNIHALVYEEGCEVGLSILLCLPELTNRSWKFGGAMTKPKKTKDPLKQSAKPKPRSPYQQVDASNYVKLIEDAVSKGTGVDDSAHMSVTVRKALALDEPSVRIAYEVKNGIHYRARRSREREE